MYIFPKKLQKLYRNLVTRACFSIWQRFITKTVSPEERKLSSMTLY